MKRKDIENEEANDLGGSRYALPVIKAAKQLGIYTITADYLPDNIAHEFSDEYVNVSIIDKEKTLEAAKKCTITGIILKGIMTGLVVLVCLFVAYHRTAEWKWAVNYAFQRIRRKI